MKITLPYKYTAEVVPPRCRKPRLVSQNAEITLTIREISGANAPVAIVAHDRENTNTKPRLTKYRWYNNRLYVQDLFQRYCHGPVETQNARQFLADPYPFRIDLNDYDQQYSQSKRRARFRAWAKALLFVDGQRWIAASEPRYVIMTFGLGNNHGIGYGTSLCTDSCYNQNITRDRYFRIDEYNEAAREAARIATARGDTKALPIEKQRITTFDVLIPEAIRLNPRRDHGKGDPFLNQAEAVIEESADPIVAGLGVMALVRT